jgi:uncharacterized protein YndB with AHSA1/START domain/DNA-binding transcriptional ArsR family regulator
MDDMDPVFRALADPHRRHLLDRLHERDGQTLTELQGYLPLSRFGTMKHLRLLEEAGLVTSHKAGREKFHYLNPVPIQRAYDRWVEKFAQPWTRMLSGLKTAVEEPTVSAIPAHVYQIYIRSTPEQVWQALTDPEMTPHYYFGTRIESEFTPGAPYVYRSADGGSMLDGTILESDPPSRLVMTFHPAWTGVGEDAHLSQVTWQLEPHDGQTKLTLTHEGLDPDSDLGNGVRDGWAQIISAMKTLLETQGAPVAVR